MNFVAPWPCKIWRCGNRSPHHWGSCNELKWADFQEFDSSIYYSTRAECCTMLYIFVKYPSCISQMKINLKYYQVFLENWKEIWKWYNLQVTWNMLMLVIHTLHSLPISSCQGVESKNKWNLHKSRNFPPSPAKFAIFTQSYSFISARHCVPATRTAFLPMRDFSYNERYP